MALALYAILILFILTNTAAYISHIVYTMMAEDYLFLLVGALIFPIGVVSGWLHWFGVI